MSLSYDSLYELLAKTDLAPWADALPEPTHEAIFNSNNGHFPTWSDALDQLPDVTPSQIFLDAPAITIGRESDLSDDQRQQLHDTLHAFRPWRKGPFNFFGVDIDTEWRSDLKWERLKQSIAPLRNRLVLDIGCGNGYHCWRMVGEGAKLALGTDPFLLYVMQNFALRKYTQPQQNAHVIPFGIEGLPAAVPAFDTVFSMGVLYHRRSPLDHLLELQTYLRPGGEIILETLVVDGPDGHSLLPSGRYAKMKNTWFIPSALTLESWLKRCRYKNVRLVDLSTTTVEEQRSTDWMRFESLSDYLDPEDSNKTIEGYPAPKRAIFVAEK